VAARKTLPTNAAVAYEPQRRASPWIVPVDESDMPFRPSPARALQSELSERFEGDSRGRWSKRATLLFILVTCGGFWIVAAAATAALIH
jgi:hypothetical protein